MMIYDIEIERAIEIPNVAREAGIEYCDGWHDVANMGVACVCAYDYAEDRYRVFTKGSRFTRGNLKEFEEIANERTLVGFNSKHFDDVVLAANGIRVVTSYDLLLAMWKGAGLEPDFNSNTHRGFDLDKTAGVNFGLSKSDSGALAPIKWQRGMTGAVIDYCPSRTFGSRKCSWIGY